MEERYEENARRLVGRNIASLPETRRYTERLEAGNGGTSVRTSLAQAASAGVPQEAIGREAETDRKETERILSGLLRKSDAYLAVRREENGRWASHDVFGTRTEAVTSGGAEPVILMDGSASGKVISCRCGEDELLVIAMDRRRLLSQEMAKAGEENEESRKNRRRY